ncbi:MAG: DNA-binding protein [Sulfurovum sp.]|nr:MAG: DNA-binding protein [Sulfurovum sp.]
MNPIENNTQNRFMTPKQLEKEYFFSEANQAQMRMKKRIPYVKIGGYVRYDRIEIDKWLEQNAVQVTA